MNTNSKRLLTTHCLRQILQNFIGTFLAAYLLVVTKDILTVTRYYIVVYIGHIVFFYLIYRFMKKISDIHIYRASLIVKLVECGLLLFMGESENIAINDYVYLIAIMEGLSQSLYYTVYKTMVTDTATGCFDKYFAFSRAGECIVSFICGIAFAEMLDGFGIKVTLSVLTICTFIAMLSSFTIKSKKRKKKNEHFRVGQFLKHTHNRHALYRLWVAQFCYGIGQGGLLAILVNLVISSSANGGNRTLGYLSSAVALFSIWWAFLHKRYIDESNFKFRLLPASIILFVISIPLALTGNLLAIIAFRFIAEVLNGSTAIERSRTMYDLIPTITPMKYRKEYFYINEVILNLSRIFSMVLIMLVMVITDNTDYLSYLFMIGTIGFFISVVIIDGLYKYCHIGPCSEAKEEMKEEQSLENIVTVCSDVEIKK